MVNLLRNPFGSLRTVAWLRKLVPDYTGLASRNGGRPLVAQFLLIGRLAVGRLNSITLASSAGFAFTVFRLVACQGPRGAAMHLKAAHVLLMQGSARMRLPSSWSLGTNVARTRAGLPRIVSASSRAAIRGGDKKILKLWLTLLSFYRVLEFPGKLSTSTITLPGAEISSLLGEAGTFMWTFLYHSPFWRKFQGKLLTIRTNLLLNGLCDLRIAALFAKPFRIDRASPMRLYEP